MTTYQLTALELKERDPKEFDRQYWAWTEYAADYDWWDCDIDWFKKDMDGRGVYVSDVEFESNYGWSAGFHGNMDLHVLIEHLGLKDKYLALWYDAKNYGAIVKFDTSTWGVSQRVREVEYFPGNCYPDGVFKDLPQEAWDAMVSEQFDAEDWEKLALDWVQPYVDKLADDLEKDYEYLTSEEAFLESCEANEITFEVEGDDDEV